MSIPTPEKIVSEFRTLDVVLNEQDDSIVVDFDPMAKKLYIHLNGITILRVGEIRAHQISID